MNFTTYFTNLWFSKKESEIFLTLYKLWTKPASTIAKHIHMERTSVYKILLRLSKSNIVSETMIWWVKHFFIPDITTLRKYSQDQKDKFSKLENEFEKIQTELIHINQIKYSRLPKITIFDWFEGIKNIYSDILNNIYSHWYISIKLFASNTFESQIEVDPDVRKYDNDFFEKLKLNKITVDTYLGNWLITMEHISKTIDINSLKNLPAGNSAINIYIVWKIVYIIIFKDIPFGIKIDSEDLAYAMHFIFEKMKVD